MIVSIPRSKNGLPSRYSCFVCGMAWQLLHRNGQRAQERSATEGERDRKGSLETIHVCRQDAREHIRPEHILQL